MAVFKPYIYIMLQICYSIESKKCTVLCTVKFVGKLYCNIK